MKMILQQICGQLPILPQLLQHMFMICVQEHEQQIFQLTLIAITSRESQTNGKN